MWRYIALSYDQLKFLTANERAGSLFPSLLIITYIYLLSSSENLTINTMSPNWSSLSFLLPSCLLENFFKLHVKDGQSVDCLLKGRGSFPLLQSNLGILLLRQKDGWQNISFCFIWSWHVTWLSVLVLRNSAKQLAVMGKIYKGKRKPFPRLESATTVIGFKFWFETKNDGNLDVNKILCRILLLFTSIITISLSIDDKTSFLAQISLSLSQ